MDEVIKEFLKIGLLPTILIIAIFLIVQDANRGEKLKSFLTKPFFRLFKWFSKTHISSQVNSSLNSFFKKNIFNHLVNNPNFEFKVKWVRGSKDSYLKEDGTLILRLTQDDDQTKNILNASQIALPYVVCPLIRSNIDQEISSAVDLTIMQNLADKLGRHAKAVFKRSFLDPEILNNPKLTELIPKLIELDKHGIYTPIFLNELELVGEELYSESDYNNYSKEVIEFISYLLTIVNRGIGDEIELNYIKNPFKLGTILLAKTSRANSQGLRPYLRRLRMKIDKGCETIYIISFPNSYEFFNRIIKTINSHESINLDKIINTVDYNNSYNKNSQNFKIAILSTNKISGSTGFKERIEANNIKEGEIYDGTVDDISESEALVNLLGLRAYVKKTESSWQPSTDCREHLEVNIEYKFKVINIDFITGTILLTRKIGDENPWETIDKPEIETNITCKICEVSNGNLIGLYNKLKIFIPNEEISWYGLSTSDLSNFKNQNLEVRVLSLNGDDFTINCSIKSTVEDPWPKIHELLPKGDEFNGKVVGIHDHFVRVEIDFSIIGVLPKESLEQAGHEYANYLETMKIGQGLNVYISKVFIKKKRIRFDLTRNKNT
jgi:predicted RNA-binding protein with RPS1 domain